MPVTIKQIHKDVAKRRPCSQRQIYRYLDRARVKPISRNLRPALWPDDSSRKILKVIGLLGIPTMNQLRAVRAKAQAARREA